MHCEENWRIYEEKIKIFSSVQKFYLNIVPYHKRPHRNKTDPTYGAKRVSTMPKMYSIFGRKRSI